MRRELWLEANLLCVLDYRNRLWVLNIITVFNEDIFYAALVRGLRKDYAHYRKVKAELSGVRKNHVSLIQQVHERYRKRMQLV